MQDSKEASNNFYGQFASTYKELCRERCTKPLVSVQMHLHKKRLQLLADRIELRDWWPILNAIAQNRDLIEISIGSRCRRKKLREKINTEEKLENSWKKDDAQQPILYTNFLLRCLLDCIAICLRNSATLLSLTLDGIPLAPKYLRILCEGLASNRSLTNISLAKCAIGDVGCDILFNALHNIPKLKVINLSSCCLTNRSLAPLSSFLKKRKADLLQTVWTEPNSQCREENSKCDRVQGLHTLILNRNSKLGDSGVRQLTNALRDDFTLKTLALRHCGITKIGADTITEFIQVNAVITSIDLKENEIPAQSLQIIGKILKARQTEEGRSYTRKKLADSKSLCVRNASRKDIAKGDAKSSNIRRRPKDPRRTLSTREIGEREKLDSLRRSNVSMGYECAENDFNIEELESRLSNMISCNEVLMKEIKRSAELLEEEKNRRIEAERICERIKPIFERFRDKFMIDDVVHDEKGHDKNQICQGLRGLVQILRENSDNRNLFADESCDMAKSVSSNVNLKEVAINNGMTQ